jgi:hypothetical protein
MKIHYLAIALMLGILLFTSGCTYTGKLGPSGFPGLGPADETTPSLQPSPTDRMPTEQEVQVQVNQKDSSYATVTTIFAGGKGQNMVKDITVTLACSDGSVRSGTLEPRKLSEVTLQGTRGTDRITVRVTLLDGKTYKVVDQEVPFKNLAGH